MRSFVIKCGAFSLLLFPAVIALPEADSINAAPAEDSFEPLPEPSLPPWNDPNPLPVIFNETFSHPDVIKRWLPTETGAVNIVSLDPPKFKLLPEGKTSRLGVMREDDSPDDAKNFAIGLQWDYSRPAAHALREVGSGFPKSEKLIRNWPWPDQMMMDLGRPALTVIMQGVASRMRLSGQMHNAFVALAIKSVLKGIKDDRTGQFERAALQLSLLSSDSFEAALDAAKLDTSIADKLRKNSSKFQKLLAANLDALRPGLPSDTNEPETWATAERAIIGELGIGAIRGLQILAATEPALAPKIAWLLSEIRHRTARELVNRYQKTEVVKDFSFEANAPSDMLAISVCSTELEGMLESLKTRANELIRSEDEKAREAAKGMFGAIDTLKKLGTGELGQASVQVERARDEFTTGTIKNIAKTLLQRVKTGGVEHLGALASGREIDARHASKYRWLAAMIEARETDTRFGYDPATDQNRLNDGRLFDLQHGIRNRGAGVELSRHTDPLPVKLKAGRTYELSYRFKATNSAMPQNHLDRHRLSHQLSWLELIPLNADGVPVFGLLDSPDTKNLQAGKYLPFSFARLGRPDHITGKSHLRSDGENGWEEVRILIAGVPRGVAGCSFRIVVNNLLGQGSVLYDDIKLTELADSFMESFENTLQGRNVPNWRRKIDNKRGFSPYYRVSTDDKVSLQGSRSMRFEPSGFNVAYETARSFPLLADNEYIFEAALRTSHMGEMRAHFEVLLFDEDDKPLNASGFASERNALETPLRADSKGHIGWPRFATHEGWFRESLDLSSLIDAPDRERGKRKPVTHVRIRLIIEGDRPNHSATIWMDALRLIEIPKVRASVGLLREGRMEAMDGRLRIARAEETGKSAIDVSIAGLEPSRAGWIYRSELTDVNGNVLNRASNIGSRTPDKIVRTDAHGRLQSPAIRPIPITRDGKAVFGVFDLQVYLKHPTSKTPAINRVYRVAALAPSHGRGGTVSVSETDNQLQKEFLGEALQPQWLAGDVSGQQELDSGRTMGYFPGAKLFGIFQSNSGEKSSALHFSNISDGRWQKELSDSLAKWRDAVHVWQLGPNISAGWQQPSTNPTAALDAASTVLRNGNAAWAKVALPVDVSRDIAVLHKHFRQRWIAAIDADANIAAALTVAQVRQLKQLPLPPITLADNEILNLVVPNEMTPNAAELAIMGILQAVTKTESPLGDATEIVANADALLNSQTANLPKPEFSAAIELGDYSETASKWLRIKELDPMLIQPIGGLFDEQGRPTANLPVWRTLNKTLGDALPFADLDKLSNSVNHSIHQLPDGSVALAVRFGTGKLPVGHAAKMFDLFGNRIGNSPDNWGEITLPESTGPIFISNANRELLATIGSMGGSNSLSAETRLQDFELSFSNMFDTELNVSAEITDLRKLTSKMRVAPEGSSRPTRGQILKLGNQRTAKSAAGIFKFRVRPMLGWSTGGASIPVRFTLRVGDQSFRFTHNVPVTMQSDVSIESISISEPDNGIQYINLTISSSRPMRVSLRLDSGKINRRRRAALAVGAANVVQIPLPVGAIEAGQKLRFTLQEDGGLAFATSERTASSDAQNRLLLAED
ncbi:MAG: hypothetical protein L3J82_00790 [Planctomycetes bacterium]|nr:hypothetical protein [Planctomycetota bacterium]